ncbi:hypothetical protein SALCHL_003764 [Streptomyces albus subsp. chlorinus]|nr:hypothetical protein [Streptomyces albus]
MSKAVAFWVPSANGSQSSLIVRAAATDFSRGPRILRTEKISMV